MNKITYKRLKEYAQQLAENCVHMHDFVGFFQEELDDKINSYRGIQSPFMALWEYEKDREGMDQEALAIIRFSYVILFSDVRNDDFEAQYNAIDEAEKLADIINSRIRHDHYQPTHFLHRALIENHTVVKPVTYLNGCFGVQVSLGFKNLDFWHLKAEDWKDIEKIC